MLVQRQGVQKRWILTELAGQQMLHAQPVDVAERRALAGLLRESTGGRCGAARPADCCSLVLAAVGRDALGKVVEA